MEPQIFPDVSSLCAPLMQHAPLPMAGVEGVTHIVRYANPAFCHLTKQPAGQIIGRPFRELLPKEEECMTLLDRVYKTKRSASFTEPDPAKRHSLFSSYSIWPVRQRDGSVGIMIQVKGTPDLHDYTVAMNQALLLGSVRQHELTAAAESLNEQLRGEIEERKKAQETLRESEERYRMMVAGVKDYAIFMLDVDGYVSSWNAGAERLKGYRAEEILGKHFSIFYPKEDVELGKPREELEIASREGFFEEERRRVRKDGSQFWADVAVTPLRDGDGNLRGFSKVTRDTTERRILEDSLVARAGELARADRRKDEFLAMLAHELRNPLAPLSNAAELLQTKEATSDERAQAQRIIRRQLENMTRMIDDLLDVSRITEGKIELRRRPAALAEILNGAASAVAPSIASRKQELKVSLPAEPFFVDADVTRLDQVFGNLLGNASKYTEPGGHISVSAERAESSGSAPPQVIVRVRDDGLGIAPDFLPRVFDLFVQSTRALDRAYGGLGIGLTLVQRLVELHGGHVEAFSKGLGCGSEFVVYLPLLSRDTATETSELVSTAPEIPCRMLIVDDNEDSARSMAMLQRRRGHETRTAFSGPEAISAAAEFLPNVVLLDIGLPGIDGFEVARRLRGMSTLDGVILIAMTGYGSDADRATARLAGFDEYLVKPVDLELLRERLRSWESRVPGAQAQRASL